MSVCNGVYITLWFMVPLRWRNEDNGRLEKKSRDKEDSLLLNKGMKDDRITVTGDYLRIST